MKYSKPLIAFFSLLLACSAQGAVTQVGTPAGFGVDSGDATVDLTWTVPAGADFCLYSVGHWGDADVTDVEDWTTGTESFVQIDITNSDAGGNVGFSTWAVVAPTAKANTITTTISGSANYVWAAASCYDSTVTTSVGDATNALQNIDNTTATSTTGPFTSAGTSGNALLLSCGAIGGDMTAVSIDDGFTVAIEGDTGGGSGGNGDGDYVHAYLLDNAPQAPTVTWAETDENSCHFIELVAAAAGSSVTVLRRRHMQ